MRSGNLCKVPALKSESSGGKQGARKSDSSENNAFLTGLHDGDRCGNWLGYSCVVALNASAVTLVFRVTCRFGVVGRGNPRSWSGFSG